MNGPHFFSLFRMAIWNRNIIVSLIAVGVWMGGLSIHLWSTFLVPSRSHHDLTPRFRRLDSSETLYVDSYLTQYN